MSEKQISGFGNYGFASSTLVKGNFDKLNINPKLLVKDSNFNFNGSNFTVNTIDGFFDGCENASFTHKLTLGEKYQSAKNMFRGCIHAYIPSVDISCSNLEDCSSMFEGCENARLSGITLPDTLSKATYMFLMCKSASFDEELKINKNMTECGCMFMLCKSGTFIKLYFEKFDEMNEYDFTGMFFSCESMNPNEICFDNICACAGHADYMFYNAGAPWSNSFDDTVLNFVKMRTCKFMFAFSRFSFNNLYIQFYHNGDIPIQNVRAATPSSIARMFYKCQYMKGLAPVLILGGIYSTDVKQVADNLSKCQQLHYTIDKNGNITDGITDFSYVFYGSSAKTADIRGICNNADLLGIPSNNIQNFTSMFEDCHDLSSIIGYIPPYGKTYENMFSGCTNLTVDISNMFRQHTEKWKKSNYNYEYVLPIEGSKGNEFSTYNMQNISGMFNGCKSIVSSNDDFDLIGLIKTVYRSNEYDMSNTILSVKDAFPRMTIATKNPIKGLEQVNYSINGISKKYGIVRYNSYDDEPYDIGTGNYSELGIYSSLSNSLFGDGFLRFGGYFKDDSTKYFCIVYSRSNGKNVVTTKGFSYSTIPNGFTSKYETDNTKAAYNTFNYNTLYLAKIYDANDGKYIRDAYVGSYTRIITERRIAGGSSVNVSREISMPVTWFESFEI